MTATFLDMTVEDVRIAQTSLVWWEPLEWAWHGAIWTLKSTTDGIFKFVLLHENLRWCKVKDCRKEYTGWQALQYPGEDTSYMTDMGSKSFRELLLWA